MGDLRAVRVDRTGGVRVRPPAQPVRRPVAARRTPRLPRHPGRRDLDPGAAAGRAGHRRRRRRGRGAPARGVGQGRARRAQGARQRGRRHDGRPPRPARAAAVLGDRQAVAAGVRRRRPRARRGPLVRRGDRPPARRPRAAARPGLQHRQLELPDERAGARRAGAVPGRQRRRREDPDPGRLPQPHPRPRVHGPGRPAGDAAVRRGVEAGRRAGQQPVARRAGLRRRPGQRPRGRHVARRPAGAATSSSRRASTPGASGTSPSGTLLAAHLRKGFEYAKQRCTAYPRYVVQRRLLPAFLEAYLPVRARACASATRSPSSARTTRCPSWTSAR